MTLMGYQHQQWIHFIIIYFLIVKYQNSILQRMLERVVGQKISSWRLMLLSKRDIDTPVRSSIFELTITSGGVVHDTQITSNGTTYDTFIKSDEE